MDRADALQLDKIGAPVGISEAEILACTEATLRCSEALSENSDVDDQYKPKERTDSSMQ